MLKYLNSFIIVKPEEYKDMQFGKYNFERTFIIAEIGDNHNGSASLAKELIVAAKDAGADAVKFQTWITEEVFTRHAPKAEYQKKESNSEESLFEMNKKLELSFEDHKTLQNYANELDILFFSKAGSLTAVDMLFELNVPVIKIGSADLTYLPLLKKVAEKKIPIILSTGMGTLGEVEDAISIIYSISDADLYLMHCTSNYPAKVEDVNLKAIETLKTAFGLKVGYSDHTIGIEAAIVAVALGACMIEKHFTLDKNMEGPDHKASLEPSEFRNMVQAIRNIEKALGDGVKRPVVSEKEIMEKMRKSIVASKDIPPETVLGENNLTCKRPGTGIPSKYLPIFFGRKALSFIAKDEFLKWEDI